MAATNNTSNRPKFVSIAYHLPALIRRSRADAYPKHLELAVCFGDEITMQFHTAGTDAIWEIPVVEAVRNDRLIKGLSPEDAMQVGIYWHKQVSKSRLKSLNLEIDCLYNQLKNSSTNSSGPSLMEVGHV